VTNPLRPATSPLRPAATQRLGAPWTSELLGAVLAANLVGLAVIATGGYEAHQTATERDAMSWLILAAVGLAVCGTANAVWLLRVRQCITRAVGVVLDPQQRAVVVADQRLDGDTRVVGVVGARRYHRPDCQLVDGKRVKALTAKARADRIACEICRP
jgi:hypothetical protein